MRQLITIEKTKRRKKKKSWQYEEYIGSQDFFSDGEKSINMQNFQNIFTKMEHSAAIGKLTDKQKGNIIFVICRKKTGEQIAKL